jgi:hypothetical protein
MRQMASLLAPDCRGARAFDSVTRATEDQFGEALKATYRAGDTLQRGMVDATFSLFTLQPMSREGWMRTSMDLMQQSMELWNRTMGMWTRGSAANRDPVGWGPVPPPPPR